MKYANKHTAESVNVLYNMVKRDTTVPFNFICVTDDSTGINSEIKTIELWDKCRAFGGCFNRLYTFSPDMRDLFGDRFMCIDLDCVILQNIDNLLAKQDDFIILKYPKRKDNAQKQHYCGGLYLMDAGCRSEVWTTFSESSIGIINNKMKKREVVGSDQAWISICLGDKEQTFGDKDGIYILHYINRNAPPKNARIIFTVGNRSPKNQSGKYKYFKDNWK